MAQFGGLGNDNITTSLENGVKYFQGIAILVIGIYLVINFMKLSRDEEDSSRAKKHIGLGLLGIAGVMLIPDFVEVVGSLTGSDMTMGW